MAAFLPVAKSILINAPICLIWLAGMGMAFIYRHEHAKVAWLVFVALLLLFLNQAIGTYLDLWMPILFYEYLEQLPNWLAGLLVVNQPIQLVVQAIAWSLLLFATFNWREAN